MSGLNSDEEKDAADGCCAAGQKLAPSVNKAEETLWPSWLIEQYGKLPLPSLYDFILSQEKLGVEIRKQNKELHNHSTHLRDLKDQLQSMNQLISLLAASDEQNEECKRKPNEEEDPGSPLSAETSILMEAMDSIFHLSQATESISQQILDMIPDSLSFWTRRKPSWRLKLEEIIQGYSKGLDLTRQKLTHQLTDLHIHIIAPLVGDSFNPEIHRAQECISGGSSHCIAKIIRYGYRYKHSMLRPADVVIYA
jgi:molecular chaperone GrpE (heat shock protein)